jgi:hypothetical protein
MKWEYLIRDIYDRSVPINWNALGADGWELVVIYDGKAYFMRELANDIDFTALAGQEAMKLPGLNDAITTGYDSDCTYGR